MVAHTIYISGLCVSLCPPQMLRLGQLMPPGLLERISTDKRQGTAVALRDKLGDMQTQSDSRLAKWDKRLQEAKIELTKAGALSLSLSLLLTLPFLLSPSLFFSLSLLPLSLTLSSSRSLHSLSLCPSLFLSLSLSLSLPYSYCLCLFRSPSLLLYGLCLSPRFIPLPAFIFLFVSPSLFLCPFPSLFRSVALLAWF